MPTLIFIVLGARDVISFCILSAMPGYMVVPPDSTVLAYRSLRISTSHFMMELKVVSWIPQDSIPGEVQDVIRSKCSLYTLVVMAYMCLHGYCAKHTNLPRKEGWKRASGHLNLSFPMVMTCPSGSS